ncbi:MAG: lysophospholipid acyltransferase family protein [Chloroflexota bacterium]|nr:MAG: hypothetical protein DLM70_13385 [Chloroflexota bacterium]
MAAGRRRPVSAVSEQAIADVPVTRNYVLYLLLRSLTWMMRFIPLSLAYALASGAGFLAFYVVVPARRSILANLSVVLTASVRDPTVRRAAREAFRTDARNWVDTLRIGRLTRSQLIDLVDVDGWEHLVQAASQGRGVVLMLVHLGNFDLVGQVVAAKGFQVTIPVERMEPPVLFDFLAVSRRSQGVDVVPLDHAPRAMLRALRAGQVVAVAGDRVISGRTAQVPFFGRPAALPTGAAALARRFGAPVVMAVGIRLPSGRFHGIILPIPLELTGDEKVDDTENTARIARVIEAAIRAHPEQWLAFSPVWDSGAGTDAAASIGRHSRARVGGKDIS